jgi:phage baseplate assembly protein W
MSKPRYRAWQFEHPDYDVPEEEDGLRLTARRAIAMIEDDLAVRQSVLLLLSTLPGERVMRPEYGCPLNQLIFSPNDDTTAGLAIHFVRQSIERFEPRAEILRLEAEANEAAAEVLDIRLEYRVRATRKVEALVMPLNLSGEPA